ncbi:MAG: GatB/YqeY domain-containing protein [Azovibrio sp.]
MSLKTRITEDMKQAMRAKESVRLGAIRLLLAAIKQKEVDERKELSDADILGIIEKQTKQRKDSLAQYEAAGREDLAGIERTEIEIFAAYLPVKMSEAEISALLEEAVGATGAAGPGDMGKLMAVLKPQLAGKADMAMVSKLVKARLG